MIHRTPGPGRLDDFGVEFEAVGDPAEAAAAAPAPAPAQAAEPSWAGPSQQEWQETQQFLGFVYNALQEPDPVGDPAEAAPPPDQDRPPTLAEIRELVDSRAAELAEERIGPYSPILNKIAAEEGKALVRTELETLMTDDAIGQFAGVEQATLIAQGLLAQGLPAEQALRQAAILQAQSERSLRGDAASLERQQITNRVQQTPEPQPAGPAHELHSMPARDQQGRDRYEQQAADWAERRRAEGRSPVG